MDDQSIERHVSVAVSSVENSSTHQSPACCFGMLVDLRFKISSNYMVDQTPVRLTLSDDSHTIVDPTTSLTFGILDQNAQKIMNVLQHELVVKVFADSAPSRALRPVKQVRTLGLKLRQGGPSLQLFATLYGSDSAFEAVGLFVAKCGMYLQHPIHCDWNVPYRNPHCLSPEDDRVVYTFDLNDESSQGSESMSGPFTNPIDFFVDAGEREILADTDTPPILRTKLYKHQMQALTFMKQRESGWALDGQHKDIWKEEKDALGRSSYYNTISGQKQTRSPPPFQGGLLIDAPGLGKSLSIIALIALGAEHRRRSGFEDASLFTTLLVVPKTCKSPLSKTTLFLANHAQVIQTWKDELQKHLRSIEQLKYCLYYGTDRTRYLKRLEDYSLVITTYSVVRLDWRKSLAQSNSQKEDCATLHEFNWGRVVLDEAHIIRQPLKSFARSVYALQAERRWAVTGTPIQNRLMDLFSLFKFLRCCPYDDLNVFNSQVAQNWKANSDPTSVAKLKTLVNCLSIRRPKNIITLPPRTDKITRLDFNQAEWQYHQRVKARAKREISLVDIGNSGTTFLNALKSINELRSICNHGINTGTAIQFQKEDSSLKQVWTAQEAQARFDQLDQVGLARCSNSACCQDVSSGLSLEMADECDERPRISNLLELWCSFCSQDRVRNDTLSFQICNHLPRHSKTLDKSYTDPTSAFMSYPSATQGQFQASGESVPTKIRRVVQDLMEEPHGSKSVVFSFWTTTLDIVQPQLRARSIRCVRLDGSLSATGRANVLRAFRNDPDIKVLLATISCGGIGLDLTAASRAYIIEPQWNPMAESQALDRIYRLGQLHEVTTTRYVMKGSYEEHVLKIQGRKQELADLTLGCGPVNKADLTFGRLQHLKELIG